MLLNWRERCPRLESEVFRIVPGTRQAPALAEAEEGRRRSAALFELSDADLETVPEALGTAGNDAAQSRHSYISNLQPAGIEVATVAKLAGHANPVTTLSVYSHAVIGGEMAAESLEVAYGKA
jgi:hypothetical protein